jgi:hypothetical protein
MKLEDFVTETIKQIINGVKVAQEYAVGVQAKVNPRFRAFGDKSIAKWVDSDQGLAVQEIEFDVAISAVEGTETKGGIGIFIGPVGLGSQGKSEASSSAVNRIKFSIPLVLPPSPPPSKTEKPG